MKLEKIDFKSSQIEVINENQSVVIKEICQNIGLASNRQIARIKADPTYQSKLIKVQTAGGVQEVFTIPLNKLNGWLFSINPNKVKPEVKDRLIEYKNECFDVLYNHFNKPKPIKNDIDIQNINDRLKLLENIVANNLTNVAKNTRPQNQNIIIDPKKTKSLDDAKTMFRVSKTNKNDDLKDKEKFYQDILKVIVNYPDGVSQRTLLKEAQYSQSDKTRRWLQEQISILWDMTIIPGKCYKYVLR